MNILEGMSPLAQTYATILVLAVVAVASSLLM